MELTQLLVLFTWLWGTVTSDSIEKHILQSATKPEMFDLFHVMPRGDMHVVQELDMLFTLDQYKQLYMDDDHHGNDSPAIRRSNSRRRKNRKKSKNNRRNKRKAVADMTKKWTGCRVYYEITESLNTKFDVERIKEAIAEWEKYSCLQFIESSRVRRRIQFTDGDMCASKVGMQDEPQPLQLASGCRTKGIIAHEIGHAIGWFHEHMRPDRDDYLNVHFSVIPTKYQSNFRKYSTDVINTYGIPYDYGSLMHYGDTAFPGSIEARDTRFQSQLGQRDGFSFKDIKLANVMYECAKQMGCVHRDCGDGFQLYKSFKGERSCQCWCDSGDIEDPLVLCSKRRSTPLPPAITLPPPTGKPPMECMDVRSDCKAMKADGKCMSKIASMMANCAKTCGFCGKGEGMCMDYEVGCELMVGQCEDPGLKSVMGEICKATCGLCETPPPDPCTLQKEMMGDFTGLGVSTFKAGGSGDVSIRIVFSLFLGLCISTSWVLTGG